MHPYYIIKKPMLTEKSTDAMQDASVYTFEVTRDATKGTICRAVEEAYGVTVIKVNTQIRKGGRKRNKYGWLKDKITKKATVRLKDGDVIELF